MIAVLTSAVSLYYYFRLVVPMYLRDGEGVEPAPLVTSAWTERVIWVCALAVLVIGVLPGPFAAAAEAAWVSFHSRDEWAEPQGSRLSPDG